MSEPQIPEGQRCAHCRNHPATVLYGPDMVSLHYGLLSYWCQCCVLSEQIRHCEEAAARLGDLREQLRQACEGMMPGDPAELIRENATLRREARRQWMIAHYGVCGRHYPDGGHAMNYAAAHPEGQHCYLPEPKILADADADQS